MYDGHGSTRQLAEYDTAVSIVETFSYDSYGVLLQNGSAVENNPGKVGEQATSLLYAGEQFDTDSQQYYLRARYYDPLNGRFNRIDPFSGSQQDPQSLHKYLYCHANPVNNIYPTGNFSVTEMLTVATIAGTVCGLYGAVVAAVKGHSAEVIVREGVKWFWIGFGLAAAIYGVVWLSHALLVALFGAGAGFGNLQYAGRYGIKRFDDLREIVRGTGLFRHHIIPDRFKDLLQIKSGDMLAIIVDKPEHQPFTNAWRYHIPYVVGTATATVELIWEKAQIIYAKYPALWEATRVQLGK